MKDWEAVLLTMNPLEVKEREPIWVNEPVPSLTEMPLGEEEPPVILLQPNKPAFQVRAEEAELQVVRLEP